MDRASTINWKRFSLRTLILAMTAVCLVFAAWSILVDPYRKQPRALAVVTRLQGESQITPAKGPRWQAWLVTATLGEKSFVRVTGVDLSGRNVDDAALQSLSGLKFLESLNLERTQITDASADVLLSFPQLSELSLRFTRVGDPTAARLGQLPQLEKLYLTSTQLSDAAAPNLAKLDGLKELYIRWTRISDAGAEELRQSLPRCDVFHHSLQNESAHGGESGEQQDKALN